MKAITIKLTKKETKQFISQEGRYKKYNEGIVMELRHIYDDSKDILYKLRLFHVMPIFGIKHDIFSFLRTNDRLQFLEEGYTWNADEKYDLLRDGIEDGSLLFDAITDGMTFGGKLNPKTFNADYGNVEEITLIRYIIPLCGTFEDIERFLSHL